MDLVTEPRALERLRGSALVPTMGALHEGHAALIRRAAALGGPVVVSLFVNPTQFGPDEDYQRYPRTIDADLEVARRSGADAVFAPAATAIYPEDAPVAVPPLPKVALTPRLEDACRPTHFAGVCQVVARLFDLVAPRYAVFGEKDYQQLLVVTAMVADQAPRWRELRIEPHPTVRESDGLALSSRNRYLAAEQREQALGLSRALRVAHAAQRPETAERMMRDTLEAHELAVEYAVVRDATTLMPVAGFDRPTRALIAARLGAVRLIDNAAMTVWR
ncbi:MAG: pantoate--beta-alanine ligase [Phycisphaerales bacterium]|nr:pantoate--beta-alanine ligase [Phycisphaerales bacterium]